HQVVDVAFRECGDVDLASPAMRQARQKVSARFQVIAKRHTHPFTRRTEFRSDKCMHHDSHAAGRGVMSVHGTRLPVKPYFLCQIVYVLVEQVREEVGANFTGLSERLRITGGGYPEWQFLL